MVGPDYKTRDVEVPTHWRATESPAVMAGEPEQPMLWWQSFGDPVLAGLVEEVLAESPDMKAAGLRVIQARSSKSSAKWLLGPIVRTEAGYARKYMSENVRPDVEVDKGKVWVHPLLAAIAPKGVQIKEAPQVSFADHIDVYNVGATALWELDFWGEKRRNMREADAMFGGALAEYDAVSVILASETALTYIQIRTIDARIGALQENIGILEKLGTSADDDQAGDRALAESLLADARARLVDLRTARAQYDNALCALLGRNPGDLGDRLGEGGIPSPPPQTAVGIPADLLRRRPDVRAAERAAAAECERIGQIKAKLYPSFSLLGSLGLAASDANQVVDADSFNGAYGARVGWDILLYPFIQERARIADARYEEAMYEYESAVVRAMAEAESALVAYANAHEREQHLKASAASADRAAESGMESLRSGGATANFDAAFTGLEYRLAQKDKEVAAAGTKATSMVHLYAALGGGWEIQEGKALVPDESRERMKERTDWRTFGGRKRLESTR